MCYFFCLIFIFLINFFQFPVRADEIREESAAIFIEHQDLTVYKNQILSSDGKQLSRLFKDYRENLQQREDLLFNIGKSGRFFVFYSYASVFLNCHPDVYNRSLFNLNQKFQVLTEEEVFEHTPYLIQPDTHRIWLTDGDEPQEISEDQLDFYAQSLEFYKDRPEVQHFFWCFDETKIPRSCQRIREMGVAIRQVNWQSFVTKKLFEKLIVYKLYGFASNLARMEILYAQGGIYMDIGLEQRRDILPLLKKFDCIFHSRPKDGDVDVRSMAFHQGHRFLAEHLTFISNLPNLPLEQKRIPMGKGPSYQGIVTGYMINAKIPAFLNENPENRIGFFIEDTDFIYHGKLMWKAQWIKALFSTNPSFFYEF